MNPELQKRIASVAADRESGASEILAAAIGILRDALRERADLEAVTTALRRAQPSMAPVWKATAAAQAGDLDRFVERVARAPNAIARFASEILSTGVRPDAPVRIVTLSYSGTVAFAIEALARRRAVHVACSEGRPALEGRRLASRLAAVGIPVTCYLDAALGAALTGADAVLVGADAVGPEWCLNKNGTRMLAASAVQQGVPAYVLAGREKCVGGRFAESLTIRPEPPADVWPDPPPGVEIQNLYFERVPLDLIAAVVTDVGVLSGIDVVELCNSSG